MKSLLLISFSFVLILFSSCKKKCYEPTNSDCENYDPCFGKRVTADFSIRQYDGFPYEPGFEPEYCDTLFPRGAKFEAAKVNTGNFSWKVANDPRIFNGPELKLLFDNYVNDTIKNLANPLYYKPLQVTLILQNAVTECVSASDTLLTKTKNLVFSRNFKIQQGRFRGKCDIDGVERIIEITDDLCWDEKAAHGGDLNYFGACLLNFPLDDSLKISAFIRSSALKLGSYKQWIWVTGFTTYQELVDGISDFNLYIEPRPDNRDDVIIKYTHILKDNTVHKITFIGKREL